MIAGKHAKYLVLKQNKMRYFLLLILISLGSKVYCQDNLYKLSATPYQDLVYYVAEDDTNYFSISLSGNRSLYLIQNPTILYSDSAYVSNIFYFDRDKNILTTNPLYSDSSTLLIQASSILEDGYCLLQEVSKDSLFNTNPLGKSIKSYLYKVDTNGYKYISDLELGFEVTGSSIQIIRNMDENLTIAVNLASSNGVYIPLWRLVEIDTIGTVLNVSDSIQTNSSLKTLTQSNVDSSYSLFELSLYKNYTCDKSLKNLQVLQINHAGSPGIFFISYQTPLLTDTPTFFVHFKPSASFDSSFIGIIQLESDTNITWKTKEYIPSNMDINLGYFNYSQKHSIQSFAYTDPECLAIYCQPNCTNSIYVESYDSNYSLKWSKSLGGDASYMIGSILNTMDGGVLGTVIRYDTTMNAFGDFDSYYFYIDSNGNFVEDYLPLGVESIPYVEVSEQLHLYPNPSNSSITLQNQKIQSKAEYIYLQDIAGRVMKKINFKPTIDISELPQGNYIYSLMLKDKSTINQKFTKSE